MSKDDYQYIASGYMHDVFRCGNYAFKTVREPFEENNCREHFETERLAMNLMREKEFCVPRECEILSPQESFKNSWTLKESWMEGKQYRDGEMPLEFEKNVFDLLMELAQRITGDYFGAISPNADTTRTWHGYLRELHENHPITRVACPDLSISANQINELIESLAPKNPNPVFITMDTNLMNFFFDDNGDIIGIIDVEQPVYGDFSFLMADIRWCRDHWFHREDWYAWWVPDIYKGQTALIDLYEFLIGFQEIELRFQNGTSHPTIDMEFLRLEQKLLDL